MAWSSRRSRNKIFGEQQNGDIFLARGTAETSPLPAQPLFMGAPGGPVFSEQSLHSICAAPARIGKA